MSHPGGGAAGPGPLKLPECGTPAEKGKNSAAGNEFFLKLVSRRGYSAGSDAGPKAGVPERGMRDVPRRVPKGAGDGTATGAASHPTFRFQPARESAGVSLDCPGATKTRVGADVPPEPPTEAAVGVPRPFVCLDFPAGPSPACAVRHAKYLSRFLLRRSRHLRLRRPAVKSPPICPASYLGTSPCGSMDNPQCRQPTNRRSAPSPIDRGKPVTDTWSNNLCPANHLVLR